MLEYLARMSDLNPRDLFQQNIGKRSDCHGLFEADQ